MKIWTFICGWPRTSHSHCKLRGIRPRSKLQIYSERSLLFFCISGALSNTVAAENEQKEDAPDLEFLEFLGQFETDAGEWIDPDSLLTEAFTELLKISIKASSDNKPAEKKSSTTDAESEKP